MPISIISHLLFSCIYYYNELLSAYLLIFWILGGIFIEVKYYLSDLEPGEKATVTALFSPADIRRRLQDIGLIVGTTVECVGRSPLGDPSAFLIRGALIALRKKETKNIEVSLFSQNSQE